MRRLGFVAALLGCGAVVQAAGVYDEIVAPIFNARCIECHGEKKQKAKLALNTWEAFSRGSDSGPIIVAGKPNDSEMLRRLRLPVEDEDHMPPKEQAQPAPEEIALLAQWVEHGASRTATIAEMNLPEALSKFAGQLPAKLAALGSGSGEGEPMWEFDAAAVARSRSPLAAKVTELQRRFPGALSYESRTSATLHFTAAGLGRDFGDAELALLKPLAAQLVLLDLSGTAITDASAAMLANFKQLRVVRAGFTSVGDATARIIATLPAIESVALSETQVTSASVGELAKTRTLRAVRLAGTAAEAAAVSANLPVAPSAADLIPPLEPAKAAKVETATK